MYDNRTEKIDENNLILKTMFRIQINSLIVEIENLTPQQLKNKIILDSYKDSLDQALLYYLQGSKDDHILTTLQSLREKIQVKLLSLELHEISSHEPPIAIIQKN